MANLNPSDARLRSFSIACPAEATLRAQGSAIPQRKASRALDVRPNFKSENSLWKWVTDHVDKQFIGLAINFLILIVLLLLLKVFVEWIQLAQMAARELRAGGGSGGSGGSSGGGN